MKRKSLFIMLLVALFVPLAMNAQNSMLKKSKGSVQTKGSVQLEMRASTNETPSNPLLSKLESAKEAALEELNGRAGTRGSSTVTASKITAKTATWTGSENETWNVSITISNTSGLNQNVTNGYAQYGTRTNYATAGTFSTSGISGTITSIDVDCASYNGAGTVSVTVGGAAFGTSQSIPSWSGTEGGTRTFTGSASGNIVVTMTNGSNTHRAMYIKSITVTYSPAGCSAPEDFAATSVTSNSATLSWTETGTSTQWVIYYMAEDDEDVSYEVANTNPYTLTGLDPLTTYYALVTPNCGDLDQDSDVITFTTADLPCSMPTNLTATNLTPSSATFNCTSGAGSYNIQYRTPGGRQLLLYEGFEDGLPDDWTETSVGSSTGVYSGAPNSGTYMYGFMRNGNNIQYLITPELNITEEGSVFAFYHLAYNANATIYVGTSTTTTATNQFTWGSAQTVTASTAYDLYAVEIPVGTKYVAIRVNALTSGAYYFVDDVMVLGPYVEPGVWHTANNITMPYTVTDLDPETEYEWQVQAICGGEDGESLWSDFDTFITPSACDAPTGLSSANVTNNSATLSWTQFVDNYTVRYGIPETKFSYDFESATAWAVDDFSPCTTYDGDGSATYTIQDITFTNQGYTGSFIAFQNGTVSSLDAHGGNAFGACFAATTPPNNDFFILPSLTIATGDVFSFWAMQYTDSYPESFKVGVYNGNGGFSSYLAGSASTSITPTMDWMQYSYDLSAYNGQTIQLAIQCVSNDAFIFCIDDLFVGNPHWSDPISVNGGTNTLTGLMPATDYTWQVQGVNCDGNGGTTAWSEAYFTTLDAPLVESITANDVTVVVDATATITPIVLPAEASQAVTFTSPDETIATVNENGVVTGVAPGTVYITIAATDGSGVTGTCKVTVNGIDVTGITANPAQITLITGETAQISYTVAPSNATDQTVTFTSTDATIATVDAAGVVTGVGVGETTITITSVSNPEVTAIITVTVTSNPNAVQFTVNAPANAAPGDVITVEGVLAGPANGTWDGFTNLALGIYYDNTAFEYVANSMVYGPVAQQAQQLNAMFMPNTDTPGSLILGINCYTYGSFVTAEGVVFSAQFTVLAETGEYTFTAEPNFYYNFDHEGAFIPYEATPSTVVVAIEQYTKDIAGWDVGEAEDAFNFYLIASPIGDVNPTAVTITSEDPDIPTGVTNMVEGSYDFYYFDHSKDLEWGNYNQGEGAEPGFNLLESGKGYLYANKYDVTLVFTGSAYTTTDGTETVELDYTDGSGVDLPGWNLVGNPFAVNAWLVDNPGFYTMDPDGYYQAVTNANGVINAMEGVFVVATEEGQSVTFTTTEPGSKGAMLALNLSNGRKVIDRAIVRFDGGRQLPKLQFRQGSTKVYIPVEGQDYAIVSGEEMGEMPVSFKAEENGSYNLSLSSEEVSFAYLHLIDNMTGADVDLLQTPSYSFEAKTTDYESRFKLVFATGDNSNSDNFAFFSNGSFVINNDGEATLQVIDVTGRILKSESINGCTNVNVNAASGVYMLRLINGDSVKVQKVVVK